MEHVPTCSTWPPSWLAARLEDPGAAKAARPIPATMVPPSALPPELFELWEERAAIMQFDGGMDRQTAEKMALADVFRRHSLTHLTVAYNRNS